VIVDGVETSACSLERVIICNVVEKKRRREEEKKGRKSFLVLVNPQINRSG
jgi:hypothetical protein